MLLPASVTRNTRDFEALHVCNRFARASLFLHGAQLVAFRPVGEAEVLWTSVRSTYVAGKAIRGGVPICFPWFGAHPTRADLPSHGFARLSRWSLSSAIDLSDGRTQLTLCLEPNEHTLAAWPHQFLATYTITIGPTLELALEIENRDAAPFAFEAALHTYLDIADIRHTTLEGLGGAAYLDNAVALARRVEQPLATFTGETDRWFQGSDAACIVHDPRLGRRLVVAKQASNTTIVWNPWAEKAARLADFGDHEWPSMLCVEAANVGEHCITLDPAQRHVMGQTISIERVEDR